MKKILKISILFIIIIALCVLAYFLFIDIKSEVPKNFEDNYNIKIEKYSDRDVFIISEKPEKDTYILYFHGGSYMAEMSDAHWNFLDRIMQETGSTVIVPDYPLAPVYNYKDVFEMVLPMYQELIKTIPPEKIIMMGDSAGGGLALALEEKLGEEGIELPNKLILLSPWLDVTMSNPQIDEVQKHDKNLNKETLKMAGIAYSGMDGEDNYLVNPINGPLDELKNITVYTGTYDILNPDVHLLERKAKEVGIDVEIKEYEKAEHIWMITQNNELSNQVFSDIITKILDK